MSDHQHATTYVPKSAFAKWFESRLPIAGLIHSSFIAFPVPRNLDYFWTFGPVLLWTMVLTYPLMSAVQLISARIGRVTGHGLAWNLRRVMPHWIVMVLVGLLFIANTINIGADLNAMADATTR